jgi:hypothetical protein
MTSTQKFYETNIIDPTIKVFTLSDIHGDIQSLIISLRDCAKVIRKKKQELPTYLNVLMEQKMLISSEDYNKDIYDTNSENILQLNLNSDEQKYISDLNYEWCGENSHVVICGDIIDPDRGLNFCLKEGGLACSYYPQIELKILMFINALNIQASRFGGKIVKLFGNHELTNIISKPDYGYNMKYTYPEDRNTSYYKETSRVNIFRVGNHGFKLLVEGGCGMLIKINNTIFVHGDLVESYNVYDDINQFINNPKERTQDNWNTKFGIHMEQNSSLFSKIRSNDQDATIRITNKNNGENQLQNSFCDNLIESFKKFKGDGKVITDDVNDLKLVIGHCPQHYISMMSPIGQNETYSTKIREDDVMEAFGQDIYSGSPIFDRNDNRTKIFGITMECLIPSTNLNRVYRIDIGSSRGFDQYEKRLPTTLEDENKYLYSKTPQILEINTDGTINIIKSKMRNTRIHLPRPKYELHARSIPELNIHTNPIQDHYKQKYLKYKSKYLQLKNLI